IARLIREIKQDNIRALFVENISDPRLLKRVAEETGTRIGGELYSGALSAPGTEADTYLKMFAYNADLIWHALKP
ncbi:MAG TPA: zinc ABC transporter substrate-binding protein, partial [Orrella sp.]